MFAFSRPCPRCYGRGRIITDVCYNCGGSGVESTVKKIKLKIPAGIKSGTTLRVRGEGQPGARGTRNGDLYVHVKVQEDSFFKLKGNDVYVEIPINIAQAILGSRIRIRTIYGNKAELRIPPGTQNGTTFRLRGLGINGGDMYVKVNIKIPENINERQKRLIEEFAKEGDLKY